MINLPSRSPTMSVSEHFLNCHGVVVLRVSLSSFHLSVLHVWSGDTADGYSILHVALSVQIQCMWMAKQVDTCSPT